MNYKPLALFIVFNCAFGSPVSKKRDLETIQSALSLVTTSLSKLDTSVKSFSTADPNSVNALVSSSSEVQTTISTATSMIQATDELGLIDALSLSDSTSTLTTSVTTVVDSLSAKKPEFDQLNVSGVVGQTLSQQKTASSALADAIVSKVPAIGQGIAQQQAGQVTAALDKGIALFAAAPAAAPPAAPPAAAPPATAPASPAGTVSPAASPPTPSVGAAPPARRIRKKGIDSKTMRKTKTIKK